VHDTVDSVHTVDSVDCGKTAAGYTQNFEHICC